MKKIVYGILGLIIITILVVIKVTYFGVFEHSIPGEGDPLAIARQKYGHKTDPYVICGNEFVRRKNKDIKQPVSLTLQDEFINNRIGMCSKNSEPNYTTNGQYTLYEIKLNNMINSVKLVGAIQYSGGVIIQTGDLSGIKEYRKSDQENLVQMGQLNEDINNYFAK